MVTALLLAAAVAVGTPVPLVGVVAVAVLRPWVFLVFCGAWAVLHRRAARGRDEASVLRAVSAELRAGATIRSALAAVSADIAEMHRVGRLATAGATVDDLLPALEEALPRTGRRLGVAIAFGSRAGGSMSTTVDRLAHGEVERSQLDLELRAATAQARLSALVVGVAPLAFSAFLVATGLSAPPWSVGGVAAVLAAVGVGLQVTGMAVVALMMRKPLR